MWCKISSINCKTYLGLGGSPGYVRTPQSRVPATFTILPILEYYTLIRVWFLGSYYNNLRIPKKSILFPGVYSKLGYCSSRSLGPVYTSRIPGVYFRLQHRATWGYLGIIGVHDDYWGIWGSYRVISEPRYVDALTGVLRP